MMYKKITLSLIATMSLFSTCLVGYDIDCLACHDVILEVKGAYFLPTDHLFKKIYGGNGIVGAEVTFELCNQFYGYVAVDYLSAKGKSIGFCSLTKMSMTNLELGFKYFFPYECFLPYFDGDFYIGIGVLPTRLHTNDCSPFVIESRTKWSCGGILKTGVYFNLPQCFVLDVFFDYSFVNVHYACEPGEFTGSHTAHLSGCWFGAGIGYSFD